jgi:hypothetical protein
MGPSLVDLYVESVWSERNRRHMECSGFAAGRQVAGGQVGSRVAGQQASRQAAIRQASSREGNLCLTADC